jgi:aconitate hydratase
MVMANLTQKLFEDHRVEGTASPGEPIGIRIDQTLTQDATGTLVMLQLEALELDRVKTELSVQYVDHNLLQEDHKNPDDHLFLESAARRFGLYFSRAGGGVSHPVHMQHFGVPGKTLLGSDSHTCAAGSLGMLAIGAGGNDVAAAMTGEPFRLTMPEVWGIELVGELPPWVSAKDVILELLRRHGVAGGVGRVLEYHGEGLAQLTAMDRHVIANMGAELGATTSVFPSDERTQRFLERAGRADDFVALAADPGAGYDHTERVDLSALVPLIAKPSSPGNVVPVEEVAGEPIGQAYIGSSANPGYRDFAICAQMVKGRHVHPSVSFDINPTSRALLRDLTSHGMLEPLIAAGARLHQAGCNGCIGMGQAPATGHNSLRTTPRNFPGRSGTKEDAVWLCSPETATASALRGEITDPRTLGFDPVTITLPESMALGDDIQPPPEERGARLIKGPNIADYPTLDPLPETLTMTVQLVMGDDVSTDEILPAGARVLPYRSNLPKIAEFTFDGVDEEYWERVHDEDGPHAVIAGRNYGQGSSREHAAAAPRLLGLRLVIAESYARIHRDNLVRYGILPLIGSVEAKRGDRIHLSALDALAPGRDVPLTIEGTELALSHDLSEREVAILQQGGYVPFLRHAA